MDSVVAVSLLSCDITRPLLIQSTLSISGSACTPEAFAGRLSLFADPIRAAAPETSYPRIFRRS